MTTRKPLVVIDGAIVELPLDDDTEGTSSDTPTYTPTGKTETIPDRYQRIVLAEYAVEGTLIIDGDLIVL